MAYFYSEPSRTFSEYLLIPGYTSEECIPDRVSLKTPLVKYRKGVEEPAISLNVPMTSAVMQSVSNDTLAIALAKEGGISFIFGSQTIENQAAMVAKVKNHKAGFVVSASNLTPDDTLADVLALKEKNGFSTVAITADGTANGKLLGIVTGRDYRVSRMDPSMKISEFMTPRAKLVTGNATTNEQYGLRLENVFNREENYYESKLWANGITPEAAGTYRCVIKDASGITKTSAEASVQVA